MRSASCSSCSISAVLAVEAIERLRAPAPVLGLVPLAVALLASAGNWGVARSLRDASKEDAAIYLAYVHAVACGDADSGR